MTSATDTAPAGFAVLLRDIFAERWVKGVFTLGVTLWLMVVVVLPLVGLLSKSLFDVSGQFVGMTNFIRFFSEPVLFSSLSHSMYVSLTTTAFSVPLGFGFAYCLSRTGVMGKKTFRALAMSPLFAPTLMHGIVLIYLFGP